MLLIKNGFVIDPKNKINSKKDILIDEGKIKEISDCIEISADCVINADNKHVFPGFVDMHCHLREPGFEYKETIQTGTLSAAYGGYTSIACMPNTNPTIDNSDIVEDIKQRINKDGLVNVYIVGSITKGHKSEELTDINELKNSGCVAVSDDGRPVTSSLLMKKALQIAKTTNITIISHSEDLELVSDGVMNEGKISKELGLKGITRASEEVMIARECIIAESLKAPIHIAHVSTEGSVSLIRYFKSRGLSVTTEACPHHFSLTDELCKGLNTLARVNPPLREIKDIEAVKQGLMDGTIDAIATDHAPHSIEDKNKEFGKSSNGMVGFETAFSLGYTNLVKTGIITLNKLIELMSVNPSRILNINKGNLGINSDADIVIVDLEKSYFVDKDKLHSKSNNTPYNGIMLHGAIEYTIVGGKIVVNNEE